VIDLLIVDKNKYEKSKERLERQILNDDVDGKYLRDLVLKDDVVVVEGVKEDLVPSTRVDDYQLDNDSRVLHR
jgi:hypothetical protein